MSELAAELVRVTRSRSEAVGRFDAKDKTQTATLSLLIMLLPRNIRI